MRHVWFFGWLAGCTCGTPPAEEGPRRPGHFSGWDDLLAAAARGDLDAVRPLARDLSTGDVPEDHPAADRVGAGLGFLQVVDDPADLPAAISRVASACGECHAASGVAPPPSPPGFVHTQALRRAAYGRVFGLDEPLPADARLEDAVTAAWGGPDRVQAVLAACLGCHLDR